MDCYFLINYSSLRIRGELILTTPKKDLIPNLDYIQRVPDYSFNICKIKIRHKSRKKTTEEIQKLMKSLYYLHELIHFQLTVIETSF